ISQYKAEARALRAEFYACLLKQYGPIIILPSDKVIEPDATISDFQLSRSPYDVCVDYVSSEFEASVADLPDWYNSPSDYGRMTKAAALAYNARLLLYAASPLWNGNR